MAMAKILLLGLLPVLLQSVEAASLPSGDNSPGSIPEAKQCTECTTWVFTKSQSAAGWSTALDDCKTTYGPTSSLVNIATPTKLQELKEFLKDDDSGTRYWTGGSYDPQSDKFVWETGVNFNTTLIGWAEGHPNGKFSTTRVAFTGSETILLQTHMKTVSLRYICEICIGSIRSMP